MNKSYYDEEGIKHEGFLDIVERSEKWIFCTKGHYYWESIDKRL